MKLDAEKISIEHWAFDWLVAQGLNETTANYITLGVDLLILTLICFVVDFIARRILLALVASYVKRSRNTLDDIFLEKKVFKALAHLAPAIVVYNSLPFIFDDVAINVILLQKLVTIYIIYMIIVVISKVLRALEHIGLNSERFEGKPISSYIQVALILSYIVGGVLVISMLVGKSPLAIITAFGAATAVILLIFRDTILGLVASIQISANDMVRLGDWVSMEKYGADGDVIEINLTTVKVRNWDKTITTVPTYAFISDSFKNWRGMTTMGVRRIKRSINVDLATVKFVTDEMRERFLKFQRVKDFVSSRQMEIDTFNQQTGADTNELINGRHMTNIGVFRQYALTYLQQHPKIDQNETIMVRQMQPTDKGLPFEIYCFSSDIAWVNYENIQGDIFDHLLAAIPKFDLAVYQTPSGRDFKEITLQQAPSVSSTPSGLDESKSKE